MTRKKGSGMQGALFQWAYESRRTGKKSAEVLKSIEEVEKTLGTVRIRKK